MALTATRTEDGTVTFDAGIDDDNAVDWSTKGIDPVAHFNAIDAEEMRASGGAWTPERDGNGFTTDNVVDLGTELGVTEPVVDPGDLSDAIAQTTGVDPGDMADLAALKANPTIGDGVYPGIAFTPTQFVVLGDASQASWDGAVWSEKN